MAIDHALEHIGDIGIRLDLIELRGFNQRADRGPALSTLIAAREQIVLASQRYGPDRALDGVGIALDTAVVEEPDEPDAAYECITDRLGQLAALQDARELRFEPRLDRIDQRRCYNAPQSKPLSGSNAFSLCLDRIEFGDPAYCFSGNRRPVTLRDLVELAPGMRPAGGKHDIACGGKLLEPGVTIDMQCAVIVFEMLLRTFGPTIGFVMVDGSGRIGSCPSPLVAGINPEPACFRPPPHGVKHRQRCVIGEQMIGSQNILPSV